MFNTLPRRAYTRSRTSLKKSREQREYERLKKSKSHQHLKSNPSQPPSSHLNTGNHPLSPTHMGEVPSPIALTLEKLENRYQAPRGEEEFPIRREVKAEAGREDGADISHSRARSRTTTKLQTQNLNGTGREREFVARKPLATNTTISVRVHEEPGDSRKLVEDLIEENLRLKEEVKRLKMEKEKSQEKMKPREALGSHPTHAYAHPLSQPPMQAQSPPQSRGLSEYQAPQIQSQYVDKEGKRRVVIPPPKREGVVRGFCDKSFGGVMKFLGRC